MHANLSDLDGYETRVLAATDRLDGLFAQLIGELDQTNSAFPWWSGHSDWKTLTLVADYLLQSLQGAEDALVAASLSAQVHRQTMYSEQEAMKDHWRAAAGQGATAADMAATIPLDKFARRRRNTITSSAEGCFFHLGQTLDRLAAAAIIVGGFKIHTAITAIYWSTLPLIFDDDIARRLQRPPIHHHVAADDQGSPGDSEPPVCLDQLQRRRAVTRGQMLGHGRLRDAIAQRDAVGQSELLAPTDAFLVMVPSGVRFDELLTMSLSPASGVTASSSRRRTKRVSYASGLRVSALRETRCRL